MKSRFFAFLRFFLPKYFAGSEKSITFALAFQKSGLALVIERSKKKEFFERFT